MKIWLLRVLVVPMLSVKGMTAGEVTGAWKLELDPDFSGYPAIHDCTFKQEGHTLAIDCGGQKMSGEVKGRVVKFQHKTGAQNEATAAYDGSLDENGTTITGVWRLTPENRDGRFKARKQQQKSR
jgi:hypothetical protein